MKHYDREFKIQTAEYVLEQGKPTAQVARDLDIAENTLYRWVNEYKKDQENAFVGSGKLKPENKEFREMRKRLRDMEEENAILKKAMHIFAKDRR